MREIHGFASNKVFVQLERFRLKLLFSKSFPNM